MSVKGIGKELRRRRRGNGVLGDFFLKMTRLDLKRELNGMVMFVFLNRVVFSSNL